MVTVERSGPGDEVPCANSNCGHAKLCHAGGKGACDGIIPIANPDGNMAEEPCSCQRFVYDDQIVCARAATRMNAIDTSHVLAPPETWVSIQDLLAAATNSCPSPKANLRKRSRVGKSSKYQPLS